MHFFFFDDDAFFSQETLTDTTIICFSLVHSVVGEISPVSVLSDCHHFIFLNTDGNIREII